MEISKKRKAGIITVCILIFLTLGFIWTNSLLNGSLSKKESDTVYDSTMEVVGGVVGESGKDSIKTVITPFVFRKMAHGTEFAVLGVEVFVLYVLISRYRFGRIPEMLCVGLTVALIDEFIQSFSDRVASLTDVAIDFSGFTFAVLVSAFVLFLIKRRRKKNTPMLIREDLEEQNFNDTYNGRT